MNFSKWLLATLLAVPFLFGACNDDDTANPNARATARFELTDAPSDDADVEAVFVTVVGVRVDGELTTTTKTTVDLLSLQNGTTRAIGEVELDARTYSSLELVLDYETDASSNAPGCYVETTDGTRHQLEASSETLLTSTGEFDLEADATKTIVLDFDVRRAIVRDEQTADDRYDFVTTAELGNALRFVVKDESGRVEGELTGNGFEGDKTLVFAYRRGSFDQSTEVSGQGSSEVQFANATTSAEVQVNGNYELNFLETGEYELHFFTYSDDDNDGRFELEGKLEVNALLGLNLLGFDLTAGADVTANVVATGVTPL